jgi:hypothetical protein
MLLVDALRPLGGLLIPGVGRSCDDSSVLTQWGHAQERNAFANILMQGCAGLGWRVLATGVQYCLDVRPWRLGEP